VKVCTVCGAEWPDDTNFCPNDGEALRPADRADLLDTIIAERYHIQGKLGEGGMGAVYLGQHVKMHRPSAIKVLTKELAHNAEAVARFNREAANAARINHPNVCAIYDFGETSDGLIYLAMEYIEGETLAALLRRDGRLPAQRAANIVAQAADALQAAHDLGIVHRDLKPDNMMLTHARDGADQVKVVDFGIAKAMGGGEEGQKVTKTGLVIGTPEYMSPEQLSGDVLDGRSDVYSLALVFYRALTGRLPFEADTAQEMLIARLTDDPIKLNDVAPELGFPPQLQAVLDRALQRMPGDRYPTATGFAQDVLSAVRAMPDSLAASTEAATQLVDTTGRDALPPTRVSPASTPATPQPLAATRPSGAARPGRKKESGRKPMLLAAATIGVIVVVAGSAAVALRGGGGATADSTGTSPGVTQDTAAPVGTDDAMVAQADSLGDSSAVDGGDATRDNGSSESVGEPDPVDTSSLDLFAISAELDAMIEQLDNEQTRSQAMKRSEAIYNNSSVPDSLRASAASMLGFGYSLQGDVPTACDWVRRATRRAPTNSRYPRMLDQLGCGQ
jgi:serine/threonine-protein kinase